MAENEEIILVAPDNASAQQLLHVLEQQPEFHDIKIWAETWERIGVNIVARTDPQTARRMTQFLNRYLGHG